MTGRDSGATASRECKPGGVRPLPQRDRGTGEPVNARRRSRRGFQLTTHNTDRCRGSRGYGSRRRRSSRKPPASPCTTFGIPSCANADRVAPLWRTSTCPQEVSASRRRLPLARTTHRPSRGRRRRRARALLSGLRSALLPTPPAACSARLPAPSFHQPLSRRSGSRPNHDR